MNKSNLVVRIIIIAVITLFAIWMIFFPRRAPLAQDLTWDGMKNNLENNINLGLDLKGGSYLVMKVKVEQALAEMTKNDALAAQNAAREAGLTVADEPRVTADAASRTYQFGLDLPDASKIGDVRAAVQKKIDLSYWQENVSGNSISWTLPVAAQQALGKGFVEQTERIINSRINELGVAEPTLQRHGAEDSHRMLLQMPGVQDPERVKNILAGESKLELVHVVGVQPNAPDYQLFNSEQEAIQAFGGKVPSNRRIVPYTERDARPTNQNQPAPKRFAIIEYPNVIDGSELRSANAVSQSQRDNEYQIAFGLKPNGAQRFGAWTGANIGKYLGVLLNGELKSIAVVQAQIFDQGQISGRFTKSNAEDLALTLRSGALPAQIEYQEERTVGPSLGADSIRAGITASIGGLVLVMLFMLFYYKGAGINAIIALLLNMLLTIAVMVWFKATLTLPGIAGLILGIGMAVDSNVLIFERIREELRDRKSVFQAVNLGFDRAFVTIIDTHITTIISSLLLYLFGTGPVQGFAVTLILGLLINLFTAVFVSRTIFMWLLIRNPKAETLSI